MSRMVKEILLGFITTIALALTLIWGASGPTFMYAMF